MPTYIWVLMTGEDYKGGTLLSMHATEEGARKAAMKSARAQEGWELHLESDDVTIWRDDGCSWVEISKRSVLP
jgi:hypothetical protein